ncbi:MAG: SafA/ExsA family spore coat assembly protein, partial [Clostridiales bacterium]|nr:SafA/ExsA family spore coat assembly protein [Clostridiales bacterium]
MKKLITALTAFILSITIGLSASAQATTYKVVRGDSLWKIAVKYEVGLSELIKANPSIKNPNLIYPGQVINIPEAAPLKTFESEVIRLINQERTSRGLPALTTDWQLSRVARYKSQDMVDRGY